MRTTHTQGIWKSNSCWGMSYFMLKPSRNCSEAVSPGLNYLGSRYNEHTLTIPFSPAHAPERGHRCCEISTHTDTGRHLVIKRYLYHAVQSFSMAALPPPSLLNTILTALPFKAMMQNYNLQRVAI